METSHPSAKTWPAWKLRRDPHNPRRINVLQGAGNWDLTGRLRPKQWPIFCFGGERFEVEILVYN